MKRIFLPIMILIIIFSITNCNKSIKNDKSPPAVSLEKNQLEFPPFPPVASLTIDTKSRQIEKTWNLVSFPISSINSLETIMEAYPNIHSIWKWSGYLQTWKTHSDQSNLSEKFPKLEYVTPDDGYWVKTSKSFELAGESRLPNDYTFYHGWNLIGYSYSGTEISISDFFEQGNFWEGGCGNEDPIINVWSWENDTWKIYFPNENDLTAFNETHNSNFEPLTTLQPGMALWVNSALDNSPMTQGGCLPSMAHSIIINDGEEATSSPEVNLALYATDDTGLNAYYLSENPNAPTAADSEWNNIESVPIYSNIVNFTLSEGLGEKTIYAWFKNTAEAISEVSGDTITVIDSSPPSNASIVINDGAENTSESTVTLTLSATDSYGVTSYFISESATPPSTTDSGWVEVDIITEYSDNITFTLSEGKGEKTIYAWFKDSNNNISSMVSDTIMLYILSPTDIKWVLRNSTQGTEYPLNTVAYGNNLYVAVGNSGTIFTSTDGNSWIEGYTGTGSRLFGLVWGNDLFVAVGDSGRILTSTDGISWIQQSSGTSEYLKAITFGVNNFVAVGNNGTILSSTDGISWTQQSSGTSLDLLDIIYNNNVFVAVGSEGTILSSSDGITWTEQSSNISDNLYAITFGNEMFATVGKNGNILTSSDAITWIKQSSGTTNDLKGISWGNDKFVVNKSYGYSILISEDGTSWTSKSLSYNNFQKIIYSNDLFIAVGNNGNIFVSNDGLSWTEPLTSGSSSELNEIVWGNETFVAVGESGRGFTSKDGVSWSSQTIGQSYDSIYGITYGNNMFVATGYSKIYTSTDGDTWTMINPGNYGFLYSIAYGNGIFVIVGNNGNILTSSDALSWTEQTSTISSWLNDVVYGNGMHIAVGDGGKIISSDDGINWTEQLSGTNKDLNSITFGNNTYVAVGDSGVLLSSTDGISWHERESGTIYYTIEDVTYGSNMFLAVGSSGFTTISIDGISWIMQSNEISNKLNGITFGNDTFVAAGNIGHIYQSQTMFTDFTPKLPDTGQTESYTDTFGEDNDYTINPPSFTDNEDGTITDNNTGLIWQKEDDAQEYTWEEAISYCEGLSLGGYSDWRLPNIKELVTIVDYGTSEPTIDKVYFPNTQTSYSGYWSQSTKAGDLDRVWSVDFFWGNVKYSKKTYSDYVRCVRNGNGSALWPLDFVDNGNTIKHKSTGLIWQKEDNNQSLNWNEAINYCESLDLDGYTDWRLPNVKELQSIVDYNKHDPAIDVSIFPNTKSMYYWSSSTYPCIIFTQLAVSFYDGFVINHSDEENTYVRCVRSDQ